MESLNESNCGKYRYCRGCLNSSDNMKPISSYREFFDLFIGIKIEHDSNHNWICTDCQMLLYRLEKFKMKALKVDKILRECFNSPLDSFELLKSYNSSISDEKRLKSTILHVLSICNECSLNKSVEKSKNVQIFSVISQTNTKMTDSEDSSVFTENNFADAFKYKNENKFTIKNEEIVENEDEIYDEIDPCDLDWNKSKKKTKKRSKKESDSIIDDSKKIPMTRKRKKHEWVEKTLKTKKFKVINLSIDEQMKELADKRLSKDVHSAKYKCEFCVKVFPYSESLQNHMLRHNESIGNFECNICHQRFKEKRNLNNHLSTHSRRYQCSKCGRILHFKITMANHLLRHKNIYACYLCDRLLKDKETYKEHQKSHSSAQSFKCSICPKVLTSKYDYGVHIRRHTGDMPFSCADCGKCFQTGGTLAAHKSVHSSIREFYCASCDVSFKTREIMMTHLRRSAKHIDPSLLIYSCSKCPKKFELESQLVAHVKSFHIRVLKLFCDLCPARFVSANGLRNHRRRKHEGLRPTLKHVCETCGRGFSSKTLVTNHLRTHTGERPFECETCHRCFSQKSSMQTHIKLVHLKLKRNRSKKSASLNVDAEKMQSKCLSSAIDM